MTEPTVTVEEIGWLAQSALSAAKHGWVAAPLTRAFYIRTDLGGWLCVGQASLGAGPLNLSCRTGEAISVCRPAKGASVRFHDGAMVVEGTGRFLHLQARRWTPPLPPPWRPASLRLGLSALDALAKPPAEGLGRLGFDLAGRSVQEPLERMAAEAARSFETAVLHLVRNGTGSHLDPVERLLGLGPGLTPSGDDYLAGSMVALELLGETTVRDTIWDTIRQRAPALTSALSFAHLQAAAAGALSEPIHLLLCSALANDRARLPARLAAVGEIGHTSGWDALAGALCVFRLWLEIAEPQPRERGCLPPAHV